MDGGEVLKSCQKSKISEKCFLSNSRLGNYNGCVGADPPPTLPKKNKSLYYVAVLFCASVILPYLMSLDIGTISCAYARARDIVAYMRESHKERGRGIYGRYLDITHCETGII